MKLKITYTLNSNPMQELEDILNWPDLSQAGEAAPHVIVYLDQKYGEGQYTLVGVEVIEK